MKINKGVYLVSKGQYMGMTQLAVKGCGMQLISVISRINKIWLVSVCFYWVDIYMLILRKL